MKPKVKKQKLVKKQVEEKFIVLDLGCGENKSTVESLLNQGLITQEQKDKIKIIGVDLYTDNADVKHDLTVFPYPFENESVDLVFSSHFLEHLDGPQRMKFFEEMYRIMKSGAKMRHVHPYYKSDRSVQDPTHKWPPICENSYLYWDKNWRKTNKIDHYLGDSHFEAVPTGSGNEMRIYYTWQDIIWANKSEEARNFAIKHYWNVIADMIVDMKKD